MNLNERSRTNLKGVHADLVRVVEAAAVNTPIPFVVIEGVRDRARQRELVETGPSLTMNSRHLTGHAVDIVPDFDAETPGLQIDEQDWKDWSTFEQLAAHIKSTATRLNVQLVWGGDWASFRDGPHYELERHAYPARGEQPRERDTERAGVAAAGTAVGSVGAWVASNPSAVSELMQSVGTLDVNIGIASVVATAVAAALGAALGSWLVARRQS